MKKDRNQHVWKNYFSMLLNAGLPWPLMILCFGISMFSAWLALDFADRLSKTMALMDVLAAVKPLLFLFFLGLLTVALKVIGAYLQAVVTAQVDRNVQNYAVDRVFYLKTADLEAGDPRELITRLTEDTSKSSSFIVELMINEIPRLFYLISAVIQVAGIGRPVLVFTLLGVIPVVMLGSFISGKVTFKNRNAIQNKIAELTGRLAEKIDNAEIIKSYGNEDKETEAGYAVIDELNKVKKQGALVDQINAFVKNMMWFLPLLLIIIPPAMLLFNKEIDQAGFYAYILIATTFRTYTAEHLQLWISLKDAQGATLRLSEILSLDNEKTAGKDVPQAGDIEFKNVSFRYGENEALHDVSFTAEKGKKTALVGVSGSGKSTVLNLIEKFYFADEGQVLMNGKDVKEYDYQGYRSLFAYLPQNAPGFSGTVREMLEYSSDKKHSDEELIRVLEQVTLYDDLKDLGGLEYEIGTGGEKLSGGQLQKLGLARLLLSDAEYVLLDEATSALDATATVALQKEIDEFCKDRTQIVVAHDLNTITNADKVIFFDQGNVIGQGTHQELAEKLPAYQTLAKEAM